MSSTITIQRDPAPALFFAPLPNWESVALTGPDREKFLSGLVSNITKSLPPGAGNLSLLLTVKGRVISELIVASLPESLVVFAPSSYGSQALHDHLDRYLFSENVVLTPQGKTFTPVMLAGQALEPMLQEKLDATDTPQHFDLGPALSSTEALYGSRISYLASQPTSLLWVPTAHLDAVQDVLTAQWGATALTQEAQERLHIAEARYTPQEVQDLLVHEVGWQLDHVDYHKGCYIGQEVVARTQHRGKANKGLFLLASNDAIQWQDNSSLYNEDGKQVGDLRAGWSWPSGHTLYRALLRLKHTQEQAPILWKDEGGQHIPLFYVEFAGD